MTPERYRRITLGALLLLGFIIVTGAAVRLTGSGLGCSDWPTCENDQLVAPFEYHAMVEFVNRMITGLVSLIVIAAVLGSMWRVPRRGDLTWLSLGLVAGVLGQIVLGGLTVLYHLAPPIVMGHFLLSMVLLANAVVLHHRAGIPDREASDGSNERRAPSRLRSLAAAAVGWAGVVMFTGTMVTGAGPHGGDETVDRLPIAVREITRVHSVAALALSALALFAWARARGVRLAFPHVYRRASLLVGLVGAQVLVGYAQYFTGVPVVLVGLHVLGATLLWAGALRLYLAAAEARAESPGRLDAADENLEPGGVPSPVPYP